MQEKISQLQESVFHLARRKYDLKRGDFDSGVTAILSKEKSSLNIWTRYCESKEPSDQDILISVCKSFVHDFIDLAGFSYCWNAKRYGDLGRKTAEDE